MALQFDVTTRTNNMQDIITSIGTSGYLIIYAGTPPASVAASLSGTTVLAALPLSAVAGVASGGVLTFNAITQINAAAPGTASFFRCSNNAQNAYYVQGTVTSTGSGGDIQLNTTAIVIGGPVQITSLTFTAPGA